MTGSSSERGEDGRLNEGQYSGLRPCLQHIWQRLTDKQLAFPDGGHPGTRSANRTTTLVRNRANRGQHILGQRSGRSYPGATARANCSVALRRNAPCPLLRSGHARRAARRNFSLAALSLFRRICRIACERQAGNIGSKCSDAGLKRVSSTGVGYVVHED
jgi:hypothetical protein